MEVIAAQRVLLDATHALGCPMDDPFMPLSFMCLPVIPQLKVTDMGVVDVGTMTNERLENALADRVRSASDGAWARSTSQMLFQTLSGDRSNFGFAKMTGARKSAE